MLPGAKSKTKMSTEKINQRKTALGMLESGQFFSIGGVQFEYMLTGETLPGYIMCRVHEPESAYVLIAATQVVTVYF